MSKIILSLFIGIFLSFSALAQNSGVNQIKAENDSEELIRLRTLYQQKERENREKAYRIAHERGLPTRYEKEDGTIVELIGIKENGELIYNITSNLDAAVSTSTDQVWASSTNGYGLNGAGLTIGEWDGGGVLTTHQEFGGRVTQVDSPSSLSSHATHVAGTLIAAGVNSNAKGMSYAANLSAHDWNSAESEMITYASSGGLVSNHSYGQITGWYNNGTDWYWYGNPSVSQTEDDDFGKYSTLARNWDSIAFNAPYYLIVKSAGNDRNDDPGSGTSHYAWISGSWTLNTTTRPADGGTTGYDCMSTRGTAKNILTIGAVSDISGGYSNPNDVVMSSFSNWGPTDDGRIKPDIVGNGISLYSSNSTSNTSYTNKSGTSMSAPNVAGSLLLLQEMYNDSNGAYMHSSTLKGLVLHAADEAGSADGPDYSFGWGMLNTKSAADVIADTVANRIIETSLANSTTYTYQVYSDGTTPLYATICWIDPPGIPKTGLDDTTSNLINDLDLRIISNATSTAYAPWILNPSSPSSAATTGDNYRDNVEKVYIDNPAAGFYTVQVTHKGNLHNGNNQDLGLIISGLSVSNTLQPVAEFSASDSSICVGDSITFTDLSTNTPTAWNWGINGGTPGTSTQQNPTIVFDTAGVYSISLTASNAAGGDTETKTAFITVNALPSVSFISISSTGLDTFCMDGGAIVVLDGATPAGGYYSGTGVFNDTLFDPTVSGPGSSMITYNYTDTNGCSTSVSRTIDIMNNPTAPTFSVLDTTCNNGAVVALTGSPTGGIFSGLGVSGSVFDPSAVSSGIYPIEYTITDGVGCSASTTDSIYVETLPTVSFSGLAAVCVDAGTQTISGGTPVGGAYFGTGVTGASFDPQVAGVGSHTIGYAYSNGTCSDTAYDTIMVNALPTVSFNVSGSTSFCVNAGAQTLSGGLPTGGIYSGTGVTGTSFDPQVAGMGTHVIVYSYTDGNGCAASAIDSIEVVDSIALSTSFVTGVCETDSAFNLFAVTPAGGVYSGTGVVNDSIFNPQLSGAGTFTLYYNYALNGCAAMDSFTVTVDSLPVVGLAPFDSVCAGSGAIALTGGTPAGGVYSGTNVSGGMFNPQSVGVFDIAYTVSNGACSADTTQSIEVIDFTVEITNIQEDFCENDMPYAFNGSPSGGTFTGTAMTDSIFDPFVAGIGTYTLSYGVNGFCSDTVSYDVNVHPVPVLSNITGATTVQGTVTYTYLVNATNGSSYSWIVSGGDTNYTTNNAVNVTWQNVSFGSVMVIETNQYGCSDTATIAIDIWPLGVTDPIGNLAVRVYPNPVINGNLTLDVTAINSAIDVTVTSIQGQVMRQQNIGAGVGTYSIETDNWSQGIYFVAIKSEGDQRIFKVIKQ